MNNISALLKEAKPLYQKKKKQSHQIKSFLILFMCIGSISLYNYQSNTEFNIEEELYLAETGGYIEDMGLETDEFGLLKVI